MNHLSVLVVGAFVPALGLLGIAWVGCDWMTAMLLLNITSFFGGAAYSGKIFLLGTLTVITIYALKKLNIVEIYLMV